jgi:hypothetical protein
MNTKIESSFISDTFNIVTLAAAQKIHMCVHSQRVKSLINLPGLRNDFLNARSLVAVTHELRNYSIDFRKGYQRADSTFICVMRLFYPSGSTFEFLMR